MRVIEIDFNFNNLHLIGSSSFVSPQNGFYKRKKSQQVIGYGQA